MKGVLGRKDLVFLFEPEHFEQVNGVPSFYIKMTKY